MTPHDPKTVWERLAASLGLQAAALLAVQLVLLSRAAADASAADATFAAALLGERMTWEWVTFLRIFAGLQLVWWAATLAAQLRRTEGEPGRFATIVLTMGTLWGAVWLLGALFSSAAVLLATEYANPAGARLAAALALEVPQVLTPAVAFVLVWAVALAVLRFGGLPRAWGWTSLAASGLLFVLAVADWWGTGALSVAIVGVALAWMAATSALLVRAYGTAAGT